MFNIDQCLKQASDKINLLEAEILLAFFLEKPRTYLHTFPETELRAEQAERFLALVERRMAGEPIAYIIGEKEFWSLSLKITSAVLIPRPETELLVELILKKLSFFVVIPAKAGIQKNKQDSSLKKLDLSFRWDDKPSILDLGTGSGAIALALASELSSHYQQPRQPTAAIPPLEGNLTVQITAIDKSEAALAVAKENACRLNISNIEFIQSSWFENVTGKFDVIVSNPPYIAEGDEHLKQGDLRFEPLSALMAEQEGLADIMLISSQAGHYLKPGGALFFEHGYNQAEKVRAILKEKGFLEIQTFQDLAGLDRVTTAKLSATKH
jgi:release factor glutamine methyltransferase